MRALKWLASAALAAALSASPALAKDYKIGYSVFWGTNPFLVTMVNGAKKAVDEWKAKGVNVDLIYTSTFAIGSSLAAAAGALLGPVYVIFPQMGDLAAVKAFAIVILGGLGNITGAVIGGFILALAEELGAGYVSSGYRDAMGFVIIIAVLIAKPTGLFARSERVG